MLLSTYESTQSSQKNDSNDSVKSINQLNIYVDLFLETFNFVDLLWKTFEISFTFFWDILNQFNWFNNTSLSNSIESVTYFMKTNWLSHQSAHLEKELNQLELILRKNESIQINRLSLVDWYTSLVTWRHKKHFLKEISRCKTLGVICPLPPNQWRVT